MKAENDAKSQLKTAGTRTANSDGDIYDYNIFNETKKIEAQEVLDIIENRIQNNFLRYQVEKCDQIYKIGEIEYVEKGIDDDAEGFQVKIKVKKNALRLEHAMRNIQTYKGNFKNKSPTNPKISAGLFSSIHSHIFPSSFLQGFPGSTK